MRFEFSTLVNVQCLVQGWIGEESEYVLFSFFLKMGQSRPLFVYFCSFLITISIQIEKSVDGVLGIRTRW